MSTSKPFALDKRQYIQDRLDKQAQMVAKRVKAKHCIVIAFFEDDENLHILEGGESPMPLSTLYEMRTEIWRKIEDAGIAPVEDRPNGNTKAQAS